MKKSIGFCLSCYGHLVVVVFWSALIAGFFYYGFYDEGDWTCYATQDKDIRLPWENKNGVDPPDEYHNVNANFKVVCIWGFFNYLLALILWLCVLLVRFENIPEIVGIGLWLVGGGWFAHFLTMMIMRWRHAGKTCSGDYFDEVSRY